MAKTYEQLSFPFNEIPIQDVAWVVLVAYFADIPHVLLAERITGKVKGKLAFPGGKVNTCEEPAAGAIRETAEETGLVLPVQSLIDVFIDPIILATSERILRCWTYMAFFGELGDQEIQNKEPELLGPWQWISLMELEKYLTTGKLQDFVTKAFWLDILQEIEAQKKFEKKYRPNETPAHILVL